MYDREKTLREKLNKALVSTLSLPQKDYVSSLSIDQLVGLKSVLTDINNTITLRLTLALARLITTEFQISEQDSEGMIKSILGTKPNANGYDLDVKKPVDVIAEVKSTIPINGKSKFGSNQKSEIIKDLKGLKEGKTKAHTRSDALKLMVLYDHQRVRSATTDLLTNLNVELRNSIQVFESTSDLHALDKSKIHIIYLSGKS